MEDAALKPLKSSVLLLAPKDTIEVIKTFKNGTLLSNCSNGRNRFLNLKKRVFLPIYKMNRS